eukprot:Platyproteum_vivax@DN3810_c0_g1_i1.p1
MMSDVDFYDDYYEAYMGGLDSDDFEYGFYDQDYYSGYNDDDGDDEDNTTTHPVEKYDISPRDAGRSLWCVKQLVDLQEEETFSKDRSICHAEVRLDGLLRELELCGRCADQGWGKMKGEVGIAVFKQDYDTSQYYPHIEKSGIGLDPNCQHANSTTADMSTSMLGIISHELCHRKHTLRIPDPIIRHFDPKKHKLVIWFKVGGGGGHKLNVTNFHLKVLFVWSHIAWFVKLILLLHKGRAEVFPKTTKACLEDRTDANGRIVFNDMEDLYRLFGQSGFEPGLVLLIYRLAQWSKAGTSGFNLGHYILRNIIGYI